MKPQASCHSTDHLTWSIIWKKFYRVEWDSCKISNEFPFPHCISGMTTVLNESKHLWIVAGTNSQLKAMFNSFLVRCECTLKWIGKISSRTISTSKATSCQLWNGSWEFLLVSPSIRVSTFWKMKKKGFELMTSIKCNRMVGIVLSSA